jgi:alkylated DNA repair dioxygenase AlkB
MEDAPDVLYISEFWPGATDLFQNLLTRVPWDARIQARQTASFGVPYNYSQMEYDPVPMPDFLLPLIDKLTQNLGFAPNNCLMNRYADGLSSMGFHRDDTANLVPETGVAIISLGAARTLYFRLADTRSHRVGFALSSGSLLYMPPEVQERWQHGVPRDSGALGERISLTFRLVQQRD